MNDEEWSAWWDWVSDVYEEEEESTMTMLTESQIKETVEIYFNVNEYKFALFFEPDLSRTYYLDTPYFLANISGLYSEKVGKFELLIHPSNIYLSLITPNERDILPIVEARATKDENYLQDLSLLHEGLSKVKEDYLAILGYMRSVVTSEEG